MEDVQEGEEKEGGDRAGAKGIGSAWPIHQSSGAQGSERAKWPGMR